MVAPNACPFCTLPAHCVVAKPGVGWVIRDAFPVSQGRTVVIPRRQIASFFELEAKERNELMAPLGQAKKVLDSELHPRTLRMSPRRPRRIKT